MKAEDNLIFFSNFLKNPKQVASVIPSSKFLINQIVKNIDFQKAECIVEYGPGTGPVTKYLLKKSKKNAKIICFETNRLFCLYLRDKIPDERLIIVNDGAENIGKYMKELGIRDVDYVISSLPFSLVNENIKNKIISNTKRNLKKGGKFIIYQNSMHVKKHLKKYFTQISNGFEPLNVPPTFIIIAEK